MKELRQAETNKIKFKQDRNVKPAFRFSKINSIPIKRSPFIKMYVKNTELFQMTKGLI